MRARLVKRPEDLKVKLSREERELVDACLRQEAGKDVDMNLVVGQYIYDNLYTGCLNAGQPTYRNIIGVVGTRTVKIDPNDYKYNDKAGHLEKNGYMSMQTTFKFKGFTIVAQYRLHELVALYKYGPYSKLFVVNHRDCKKINSIYSNIEVITQDENILHATICNVLLKQNGWDSLPVGLPYKDIPTEFKTNVHNRNKKQYKEDLMAWYKETYLDK